ncbi:MAG: DUF5103 domain-containing protein [Prevotella sp.]|nr:DUF5103 domain-containing protein [Prevotella sp.]
MRKVCLFIITTLVAVSTSWAQRHEILSPRIATLQVVVNDNWQSLPVMKLHSSDRLHIDFDDLTHEYSRYAYRLEHCEADWTPSEELFASDYVDGFREGNLIEDAVESINTTQLYTHYSLTLPNAQCRPKISGNYKLTVYDDNTGEDILTACFMISEEAMGIGMSVTSVTDIDINNSHQQVDLQLNYNGIRVTNVEDQLTTVLMQNNRWDIARQNAKPQYVMNDGLQWIHCRDFIFDAGNTYRKYEILDVTHPTMGIERINWNGENYEVYPFVDEPRPNYLTDEASNGGFFIRNSDNIEIDNTCEYVWVFYQLKCPKAVDGEVYLNGMWTNDLFLPQYKMEYDEQSKSYRAAVYQKQGYYSYQYLWIDSSGSIRLMPTEGNFYQTRNSYQALVYYKGTGERTDRLVAFSSLTTK